MDVAGGGVDVVWGVVGDAKENVFPQKTLLQHLARRRRPQVAQPAEASRCERQEAPWAPLLATSVQLERRLARSSI